MSKHQEAPAELERVRAFVNTLDGTSEELRQPADLARWLVEHGFADGGGEPTRAELRRAIAVREALRAVLLAHTDGTAPPPEACRALDEAAFRARLALRFGVDGGARLEPESGRVDGALGRLLAIVHQAIAEGTWGRLKACRDATCLWAFYDHTKNHSGTWCTMEVCGNRAKARAYRRRTAGQA